MYAFVSTAFILGTLIGLSIACMDGWVHHGDSCYHFSHDLETWPGAMYNCQVLGGYLVEIGSIAENKYVTSQTKLQGGAFWLGLSDLAEEGTFKWMYSQTPLDNNLLSLWDTHQPDNNDNNENCGYIPAGTNQWHDGICGYTPGLKYVCERPAGALEVVG